MPKSWLIQHPHNGELSGVSTYVESLRSALERRGHTVRVVSSATDSVMSRLRAIVACDVVHLNSSDLLMAAAARLVGRPTVIKYHWPFWLSTFAEYRPLSIWRRLATEIRFIGSTQTGARGRFGIPRALIRLVGRVVTFSIVDVRIACSSFTAKACDLGSRVSFVPNPVSADRPSSHRVERRIAVTRDPEQTVFLFAGRLTRSKGVDTAIRAVATAAQLVPDAPAPTLWVAGDGEERESLEALAESLFPAGVKFLGRVDNAQVKELIRESDALIFPIRWEDPAPYPPLEAALESRVTVGYNKGGISETATEYALLSDADSFDDLVANVVHVMIDREGARSRGRLARERALEVYSEEPAIDALRAAFSAGF